jgi:hypothetical protein
MSRYMRLATRWACAGLLVAAAAWLLTAGAPRSPGAALAGYGNSGPRVQDVPAVTPAAARRIFRVSGSVGGLYPGRKLPLVLTITNPQRYAITVTAITTKVGNASAACFAMYLTVSSFTGSLHLAAGHATGGAYTMPAGTIPTASATGTRVAIRWPTVPFPNGTPVAGYLIHRYSASGTVTTIGATCAGVVAGTTCSEMVPPGTWTYPDTPVQLTWSGTESPASDSVGLPLT